MPKRIPNDVPEGHKWCHQCATAKPHSAFYRNKRSPDGLLYCCKACTAATRERTEEHLRIIEEVLQESREMAARRPPKVYEPYIPPLSVW